MTINQATSYEDVRTAELEKYGGDMEEEQPTHPLDGVRNIARPSELPLTIVTAMDAGN